MLRRGEKQSEADLEEFGLADQEAEKNEIKVRRWCSPMQAVTVSFIFVLGMFIGRLTLTFHTDDIPEVVSPRPPPIPTSPTFLKKNVTHEAPQLSEQWPAEWLKKFSKEELEASEKEAEPWRIKTLNAMKHAYIDGYRRVYGSDTVNPITGKEGKQWGHGAYTMVDSLSTLWLMGQEDEALMSEFNKAAEWIDQNLHFDHHGTVSVFETIIRELGGLLSAYGLSKNPIFKRKALELGEKLMPAFRGLLPMAQISLGGGRASTSWFGSNVLLAEVGTLQLEFRYLSEITGDKKFREKGDAAMDYLLEYGGSKGLVPWGWGNGEQRKGPVNTHITMGAMADSYYEYLLKMYVQGGMVEKDIKYLHAWQNSMKQMEERLVRRSGTQYAAVIQELSPGSPRDQMDHLTCFVGGMLVMGDSVLKDNDQHGYMSLGRNITAGCYEMYQTQKSGLAPDNFRWAHDKLVGQNFHNDLRPETAESIFYLFYYTGNPIYRRMAGSIIDAFEKESRCPFGYCALENVAASPAGHRPDMESFFLAETLKYLYLTFVPRPHQVLPLDKFVFNTEAHPLPMLNAG